MEIYGTMGPACQSEETLREMLEEGMTGIRLNLSHSSLERAKPLIDAYHRACAAIGTDARLLIDMQGPEMRIDRFTKAIILEAGKEYSDLPIPEKVSRQMTKDDIVLIDDGIIKGRVLRIEDKKPVIHITRGGILTGGKSVAIEGKSVVGPAVTAQDKENLALALTFGVTDIMQPFVRNAEDLKNVRKAMEKAGCPSLRVHAKIENLEGLSHLNSIIKEADDIVIARGDLGSNMPLWRLPSVQKQIAYICRQEKAPFMVVTQMLTSMTHSPVPTRAELNDIYNSVMDGASSVMVTGETAIGDYPVEVIRYLVNTVREALKNPYY